MSTQTVYFNNPADITALQNTTSSMSGSITSLNRNIGLDTVLNQSISSTGVINYLLPFLTSTVGTGASTDLNGVNYKNLFAIWGNGYSGEEYFWATGPLDRANANTYTKDTYVRLASLSKIVNGLFMGKLMEEGYFKMDETVGSYLPEFSSGNYNYVVSATGNYAYAITGTVLYSPIDYASWTGPIATSAFNTITISQIMGLEFLLPYDFLYGIKTSFQPVNMSKATYTDTNMYYSTLLQTIAIENGNSLGTGALTQSITGAIRAGPIQAWYNDSSVASGPNTDYVRSVVNSLKIPVTQGGIALAYKVGTTTIDTSSIATQYGIYSGIAWAIMSAVANRALQLKQGLTGFAPIGTYSNYVDYARKKILTPLGITSNDLWFELYDSVPAGFSLGTNMPDGLFRRNLNLSTGFWSDQMDPNYFTDNKVNSLVWCKDYPNDGISRLHNASFNLSYPNDPYGPRIDIGINSKISAITKLFKLYINKGVYNNQRIINRNTLNYLRKTNAKTVTGLFYITNNTDSYLPDNHAVSIGGYLRPGKELANVYQATNPANINTISFGITEDIIYWSAATQNNYVIDLDSGTYVWWGTNMYNISSSASKSIANTTLNNFNLVNQTSI